MRRYFATALLALPGISFVLFAQDTPDPPDPRATEPAIPGENVEAEAGPMTVAKLQSILSDIGGDSVQKSGSAILFEIRGINMICIFDDNADRMRVISPIKSYDEVSTEELDAIMNANFHGALDGRYASSEGILYAAYVHPLSSLSRGQLLSGIFQVASLRVSYGKEYSSGLMTYGGKKGPAI